MACVADGFSFSRRGDRASERANERAWGKQKKGRCGEGLSKKKEEERGGEERPGSISLTPFPCFLFCRTSSQFRSLSVLLKMNAG